MPYHGVAVACEFASCGIAPAARTQEVDTEAAEVKIGMIIHLIAVLHLRPQAERIVTIRPDIAIDYDSTVGLSIYSHLVGGIAWLYHCAVVIVYRESADDAAVGLWGEHYDSMMEAASLVCLHGFGAFRLCYADDCAVAVLSYKHYIRTVNYHLLLIEPVMDEYLEGATGWSGARSMAACMLSPGRTTASKSRGFI